MTTLTVAILCVFFGAWLANRDKKSKQINSPAMDGIINTAQLTLDLSKQNMKTAAKVLDACQQMVVTQGQATQLLIAKIEKLVTEDILDARLQAMFGDEDEDDLVDEDEVAEEKPKEEAKKQDSEDVIKLRAANLRLFRTIEDFRRMVETSDKIDPKLKAKFQDHLKIG